MPFILSIPGGLAALPRPRRLPPAGPPGPSSIGRLVLASLTLFALFALFASAGSLHAQAPGQEAVEQPAAEPAAWRAFLESESLLGREYSAVPVDAYLGVLQRWAERPGRETLELYTELDRRLRFEPHCLADAQEKVSLALAETRPELSTPILVLEAAGWVHHFVARRWALLGPAHARILRSARFLARHPRADDRLRHEVALVLTYYAAQIWESGYYDQLERADQALDLALRASPTFGPARHLRAVSAEKQGRYERAAKDLETLLEQPSSAARSGENPDARAVGVDLDAVRLRLAIQHTRLGREDRAEAAFRDLLAAEEWISILAYQELARLEARRQQLPDALALLAEGLERHPENERIQVLRADFLGRLEPSTAPAAASRELVAGWSTDRGGTPRLRYEMGPGEDRARVYEQIDALVQERRQALAQALRQYRQEKKGRSIECVGLWRRLGGDGSLRQEAREPELELPPELAIGQPLAAAVRDRPRTRHGHASARGQTLPRAARPEAEEKTPASPPPAALPGDDYRPAVPEISTSQPDDPHRADESAGRPFVDDPIPPGIRIDDVVEVELQQIYVTARRRGRPATDLSAADFTLLDQGREQELATFEQGDVPFTAALLLDASGSMAGERLERAIGGARAFVGGMGPHDKARILVAADRIRDLTGFVTVAEGNDEALLGTLDRTSALGSTALFDHLFLGADLLRAEQGRRVMIVLSDGFDKVSVVPTSSIRRVVQHGQVQLYWIRLRPDPGRSTMPVAPTAWRPLSATRDELRALRDLVRQSGGRVVDVERLDQVDRVFAEIVDELRNQVALGYVATPEVGGGRWRTVTVKTSRPGVRLRHVAGYIDR